MNKIIEIRGLLNKLSKQEVESLKFHFIKEREIEKGKTIKLLDALSSREKYTKGELEKYIYGKNNYHAFNKLINRLEDKILETLSLIPNLSQSAIYSNRNSQYFTLRKMLLNADILQSRGEIIICERLYRSIIKESKKLEFYDLLLRGLNSYERLKNLYNSKSKKLKAVISEAENCRMLLDSSRTIYNSQANNISTGRHSINFKKELEDSVSNLLDNYLNTNSPTIGYYYYTLKVELQQQNKLYEDSCESLLKLERIVLNNESVFTKNRYGTVLLNIGNVKLLLGDFDESIRFILNSKKYFVDLNFTLLIADEVLFFTYFHSGRIDESLNLIDQLISSALPLNIKLYNKFIFYKAWVFFKLGNFHEALINLTNIEKREFEAGDDYVYAQIVRLMCLIELENLDLVESLVSTVEKYILRKKSKVIIDQRSKIIIKIIYSLNKLSFEKARVKNSQKVKSKLNLLKGHNSNYAWTFKSSELIKFDQWLAQKFDIVDK